MRTVSTKLVAVVLASIVGLTACGKGEDSDTSSAGASSVQETASSVGARSDLPEGALIDDTRRSWPGGVQEIDDSQYETPGQYSVELYGTRPVWVPANPLGDVVGVGDLENDMSGCSDPDFQLAGKTQLQYVRARYLTVNDVAGPTNMKDAVPSGYAHSVTGAVIAAINQVVYGWPDAGDEIGEAIKEQLWSTSDSMQDLGSSSGMRPRIVPVPDLFGLVTCTDDMVIVELAYEPLDDEESYANTQISLYWRDGDWVADFTGRGDQLLQYPPRRYDAADLMELHFQ